jgi:hypothetical protein
MWDTPNIRRWGIPACVSVAFDGVSLNNHHYLTSVMTDVSNYCMKNTPEINVDAIVIPAKRVRGTRRTMPEYKEKAFENHVLEDSDLISDDYDHYAYCPTCGRSNPINHSPEWLLSRFSGQMAKILAILIEARRQNKSVSGKELFSAMYAHRSTEVPLEDAASKGNKIPKEGTVFKELISLHRVKLWELGWDIVGPRYTGVGYQLVPLVIPQQHPPLI